MNNGGQYGAAIYNLTNCSPRISNCSFTGNSVQFNGGAIFNQDNSNPILINCSFLQNQARLGGAIRNYSSHPKLINCSFQNNTATGQSGGSVFYNSFSSNPILINSVLFGNGAGDKYFFNEEGSVTATNSLFDQSVTGYNMTEPTNQTTTTSPFSSSSSTQLAAGSLAINAGNSLSYIAESGPSTDLAGSSRFVGPGCAIDMGAYEAQAGSPVSVIIQEPPLSTTAVCISGDVSVSASATGSGPLSYQWHKNGQLLSPAQSTSVLSLSSVTSDDQGSYSLVVTGTCNSVTSTAFRLRVNLPQSVSVTASPSTTLTCANPILTLTPNIPASAFRWTGGTSSQTLTVDQTGAYSVTIIDSNECTAISSSLTISQDITTPTISISALGTRLTCENPSTTLTATSSGTSVHWSTGAMTTSLMVNQGGTYSATATGANGCTTVSNSLSVTQDQQIIGFAISSGTVCQSQVLSLSAAGCPGGTVIWSTGITGEILTMTAGNSTSILTATCTIGSCSITATGSVVISGLQPPPATILSLRADESTCPVRLAGRATGPLFIFTGPSGYVFSNVYRSGGTYDVFGDNVKQPGIYTLTATYTNECGSSIPVRQSVTVRRSCP